MAQNYRYTDYSTGHLLRLCPGHCHLIHHDSSYGHSEKTFTNRRAQAIKSSDVTARIVLVPPQCIRKIRHRYRYYAIR